MSYSNEHESAGIFDKKEQRLMNVIFYGCVTLIVAGCLLFIGAVCVGIAYLINSL